jgi:hypothetical protein
VVTREALLRSQWSALRSWIEESGLLAHAQEQSVLEAWNVHELVTHLGRSFLEIPVLGPAAGVQPLTLRAWIAAYRGSATDIADGTRQLARSFAGDVLGGIDGCARLGLGALAALHSEVVRGPRGAITLDDFIMTRLVELVVHGDDLARSVPELAAPPLLDEAVASVADALAGAYAEVTGHAPDVDDRLEWIRAATGRSARDDTALPLL